MPSLKILSSNVKHIRDLNNSKYYVRQAKLGILKIEVRRGGINTVIYHVRNHFMLKKHNFVHCLFVCSDLLNFKITLVTVCLSDVSAPYWKSIFRNVENSIGVSVKLTWVSCWRYDSCGVPLASRLSFVHNKSRISGG